MGTITAAELRNRRITIQQVTRTPDENGDSVETWVDVAEVWARIQPIAGKELWIARQAQSRVSHRFNILYRTGITADMRAVMNGRTFNFESVINRDEVNEELEILATEVV